MTGDVNIDSPQAYGEASTAAGGDAAGSEGTIAKGGSQVADANEGAAAATGGSTATSQAGKSKGSTFAAITFFLILVVGIVLAIVGVELGIVAIVFGGGAFAVSIYKLAKGD